MRATTFFFLVIGTVVTIDVKLLQRFQEIGSLV